MWYFESKISCFGGDLGLPCLDYVGEIVFSELNQNFPSVFIAVLVVNITRHAICFAVVLNCGGGSFFFSIIVLLGLSVMRSILWMA